MALSTETVPDQPRAGAAVVLRPSLWRCGARVGSGGALAAGAWLGGARLIAASAAAWALAWLITTIRHAASRTELSDAGLAVHSLGRVRHLAWSQAWTIEVVAGFPARRGRVTGAGRVTPPVILAGLVGPLLRPGARFTAQVAELDRWSRRHRNGAGLDGEPSPSRLAMAALLIALVLPVLVIDRPDRWLPGAEVAGLPDACAAVPAELLADPDPERDLSVNHRSVTDRTASCLWRSRSGRVLTVVLIRSEREGLISGSGVADRSFDTLRPPQARPVPQPDLGDEAAAGRQQFPAGPAAVVIVRKANVNAIVVYLDPPGEGRVRAVNAELDPVAARFAVTVMSTVVVD